MRDIRHYFNRAANTYEKYAKLQRKIAEELIKKIELNLHYETVVEIGSGIGFLSNPLSEKLSYDKFIHIDISHEFLKKLRDRVNKKHFFINAKAEVIPIKSPIADLLVSSSALHWTKEPEKNFIKILDILKNDGKFYFSIFTSNTLQELKKVSELTGFGSVYPLKEYEFYIKLLRNSPFSFKYELKTFREEFSSPEDLLKFHKLTGTNYTLHKRFSGKENFKKFCDVYRSMFGNSEGILATYEVLFIQGQK